MGVVVVTHNSADFINPLLDSLPAALAGISSRVIVVDSGSSDTTVQIVRERADCNVIAAANIGYAAAINRGAAELSDVTAILVLNPDLVLSAGCVPTLLAELSSSGVGIVVPRLVDADGNLLYSLRNEPTIARALGLGFLRSPLFSETIRDSKIYQQPGLTDWATGAVMLTSSECFTALGGWDESFFLYSEETDYCLRARQRGWRTRYTPAATALHVGGGSGRNDVLHGMQLVNRVRLYGRAHHPAAAYVYLVASAIAELSWLARGRSRSTTALRMLLFPRLRPAELGAGGSVIPR